MDKEKQIQSFMAHLKISREEAEQLYADDEEDFIGEDGEKMQTKAKEIKRYEQSDKPRKKSTRERKIDEEKKEILNLLMSVIDTPITSVKNEAEFSFSIGENDYSVKLIKHRKKKA